MFANDSNKFLFLEKKNQLEKLIYETKLFIDEHLKILIKPEEIQSLHNVCI